MENRIAHIISYIFHPVMMPTLGIFLLFNFETYLSYSISSSGKIAIYSIVFINTAVVPALLAYFQYRFKLIKSLKLETKEDRVFPFMVSTFFYFFCFYILKKNNLPPPVYMLMLGAAISFAIAFAINFFWKISIHSIGVGGILGMLFGVSQKMNVEIVPLCFYFILVAGITGFARLQLNAHQPAQVYAGFALGFFCLFGALFITM